VRISGAGFTHVTAVYFGTTAATFRVNGEGSLTATRPPGKGTVEVTVTTTKGASSPVAADHFTCFPRPSASTGQATEVAAGKAVLNATVNPNGGEVTSCKFE